MRDMDAWQELGPIVPHEPAPEADLCCEAQVTCAHCRRPVRMDRGRWRADIDGRGAEFGCYPEYEQ